MATTDRLSDLNSQRSTTDRIGQTVILGNAIEDGAASTQMSIIAASVGAAFGSVPISSNNISTLTFFNGSTGLWIADINATAATSLSNTGASVFSTPFSFSGLSTFTFGNEIMFINNVSAKTGTFNVTNADVGTLFECSGTFSVTFDALSTFDSTFYVIVRNTGTGTITLDPNGTEEIEIASGADGGDTTITLPYSGSTTGPYNVSGVILYKSAVASTWGAIAVSEVHGFIKYTANDTFVVPKGVTTIWVTGQGGGGAGGGAPSSNSSGAGGGSSGIGTIKQRVAVVPGASHSVTIGAGGTGVSGGTGNNGGTTSLGALVSLAGGTGAGAAPSAGAASAGAYSSAGGAANAAATGGCGGPGLYGGSGSGSTGAGGGVQAPDNSGGGGGGADGNSASNFAGGSGGSGFLIVEW